MATRSKKRKEKEEDKYLVPNEEVDWALQHLVESCDDETTPEFWRESESFEDVMKRTLEYLAEHPPKNWARGGKHLAVRWSKPYIAEFRSRFRREWNEFMDPNEADERKRKAEEREEAVDRSVKQAYEQDKQKKAKLWADAEQQRHVPGCRQEQRHEHDPTLLASEPVDPELDRTLRDLQALHDACQSSAFGEC